MTKGKTMTRMRLAPNLVRLFGVLVPAALITLVAGCTNIVPGTVRAAPNLKPRPLTRVGVAYSVANQIVVYPRATKIYAPDASGGGVVQ